MMPNMPTIDEMLVMVPNEPRGAPQADLQLAVSRLHQV